MATAMITAIDVLKLARSPWMVRFLLYMVPTCPFIYLWPKTARLAHVRCASPNSPDTAIRELRGHSTTCGTTDFDSWAKPTEESPRSNEYGEPRDSPP